MGCTAIYFLWIFLHTSSIEFITKNKELRMLGSQDEVIDYSLFLQDGSSVYFSLSTKGNGILSVKNRLIHVYDSHDNGNVYKNRWSNLIRIDLPYFDFWINSYTQINTNKEKYHTSTEEKVVEIWGDTLFFRKLIPFFQNLTKDR